MNKSDLIFRMVERLPDTPQHDIEQAVKLLLDQLSSTLAMGARCEIRGFGAFSVRSRQACIGRNPKTGDSITLPERHIPHFKPAQLLKAKVNVGRTENPIQDL